MAEIELISRRAIHDARIRLADPRVWNKGWGAPDRLSLLEAIYDAWPDADDPTHDMQTLVQEAIEDCGFGARMRDGEKLVHAIARFNDHPATTHADVVAVLARAEQLLTA